MRLSVVMPVYSEDESIKELISYFFSNLNEYIHEVIIIYHPNSKSECLDILNNLNNNYSKIKIFPQDMKEIGGNGNAYRQGFKHITGSHVLMIDSDGEMDVQTVPLMINKMKEKNCDIVIGSRFVKGGGIVNYPLKKLILNITFQYIFRLLFLTKIKDLTCGYKLLKKEIINKYKWTSRYQDIGSETTLRPLRGKDYLEEVATVWTRKKGEKHSLSLIGNFRYPILAIKVLLKI